MRGGKTQRLLLSTQASVEQHCNSAKWGNPFLEFRTTTSFPRKLQHTPGAHPRQSPYPTMKGFPLQPVGKGLGVCSKGVLKWMDPI